MFREIKKMRETCKLPFELSSKMFPDISTGEVIHSPFLAQKSNQNTWFSATLVFSLVFRWFSAVSPTLCTVVYKKTKRSCFGGFFSLVFEIQATAWFSWSYLHAETRNK
jgi:hypothetical protein